jgi:hypothetical protein
MEVTGYDYMYVANADGDKVAALFVQKVRNMWPSCSIDNPGLAKSHVELYFEKDEEMGRFQEENGYSLNENGEGCFMLFANRVAHFEGDARLWNVRISSGHFVDEAKLLFRDVWEYTLVLPALICEGNFSERIQDFLTESIAAASEQL